MHNHQSDPVVDTSSHNICKNCDTPFKGTFCPSCGQSINDHDKPLKFIFVDVAGNLFAFDTRVWRTIKSVLFYPGKMEKEYAEGKRVRYMPPFRFYVFVSFFFFLLISWLSDKNIQKNRDQMIIGGKGNLSGQVISSDEVVENDSARHGQFIMDSVADELKRQNVPMPQGTTIVDIKNQKILKTEFSDIIDNPEKYFSRFIKYLSWSLFLLMPVYAALLWLFFRKTRPLYMAHFHMSINHHVFIFLVIIIITLIQLILPENRWEPENYLGYLIPFYALAGARNLYRRTWFSTLWRLLVILVIYMIVLLITMALLAVITFS